MAKHHSRDSSSIVALQGEYDGECGYCGSSSGRWAWGASAKKLKVEDYQDLCDAGWRRSGTWVYLPSNKKTCCVQYTIRLDTTKFVPSKHHKQVLKKVDRFLSDVRNTPQSFMHHENEQEPEHKESKAHQKDDRKGKEKQQQQEGPVDEKRVLIHAIIEDALKRALSEGSIPSAQVHSNDAGIAFDVIPNTNASVRKKRGDFSSNVVVKILASLKKAQGVAPKHKKKKEDLSPSTSVNKDSSTVEKSFNGNHIAQTLAKTITHILEDKHSSEEIKVNVNGQFLNFIVPSMGMEIEQQGSHVRADECSTKSNKSAPTEEAEHHQFKMKMVPASFSNEKFQVYKKYQMHVHGDAPEEVTVGGFERFLCKSPLFSTGGGQGAPECGYGAFHQEWRLDGKLIAVGVVDVLPKCLSSVYFFYDPDYSFMSLGVYSALKEIEWVQNISKSCPQLKYYYMGYYIHTCPKMQYKGQYKPSDLLCPETHQWVPLEDCLPLLESKKYTALSPHTGSAVSKAIPKQLINSIPLLYKNDIFTFDYLTDRGKRVMGPLLEQWLEKAGPGLALDTLVSLG